MNEWKQYLEQKYLGEFDMLKYTYMYIYLPRYVVLTEIQLLKLKLVQ